MVVPLASRQESEARPPAGGAAIIDALNALYADIAVALGDGPLSPREARGRQLLDRYIAHQAAAQGRTPADPALVAATLALIERNSGPRAARYWELIGIIKGWPPSPVAAAHDWLVAGLRERIRPRDAANDRDLG